MDQHLSLRKIFGLQGWLRDAIAFICRMLYRIDEVLERVWEKSSLQSAELVALIFSSLVFEAALFKCRAARQVHSFWKTTPKNKPSKKDEAWEQLLPCIPCGRNSRGIMNIDLEGASRIIRSSSLADTYIISYWPLDNDLQKEHQKECNTVCTDFFQSCFSSTTYLSTTYNCGNKAQNNEVTYGLEHILGVKRP